MKLEDHVKSTLQSKANGVLALEYDGSGDMWHYVTLFDHEYGINVWNADEFGDGTYSGLRITVYPTDDVTGDTNFDQYDSLKVEPLALKVCKLRLKLKGREV
jgi:hypothetical protein